MILNLISSKMRPHCDKLVQSCAALEKLEIPINSCVFDTYCCCIQNDVKKALLSTLLLGRWELPCIRETEDLFQAGLHSLSVGNSEDPWP